MGLDPIGPIGDFAPSGGVLRAVVVVVVVITVVGCKPSLSVATGARNLVACPRKPLPVNTAKCVARSDGAWVRSGLKVIVPVVLGSGLLI